jgi:uncharacterized protein
MTHPIPAAALAYHIAILGKTGSGKSNAAKVVAEDLMSRGERVCAIDPTGTWWGLRLDAGGKRPSAYPVAIFGGSHADLPIGATHGAAVAEAIGTSSTSAIIDTRLMKVSERTKFFTDFAETLLQKNRGPLHLIIDECHVFMPQGKVPDPQSGMMLHAANNLVSLGRGIGLRIMLISQRPAKVHKDSLTQVETLVAQRLIAPQDRRAIEDWIGEWAGPKQGGELLNSLPSMKTGDAWIWSPELGHLERARFPLAKTFDSGRPRLGESGPELQPIDLTALKGRLSTVEAEFKANDPKALRAEIAALKRQLSEKAGQQQEPDPAALNKAYDNGYRDGEAAGLAEGKDAAAQAVYDNIVDFAEEFAAKVSEIIEAAAPRKAMEAIRPRVPATKLPAATPKAPQPLKVANGHDLTAPQRRVLRALAMWKALGHENPSREMVAAASGYSPSSGGFNNLLGGLATSGAIGKPMPGHLSLLIDVGEMSADEGRDMLLGYLSNPQRKLVDALNGAGDLSRADLGEMTGYSPSSGGFNNLIGSLSTLGLITKPAAGYVALSPWAQELLS